jgi:hypothetical protein
MSSRHRPGREPSIVLAVGIAAIALLLVLTTSVRMPVLVSFDESVYKIAAAHYAGGGLDAILHDGGISRGLSRLYSILLAPVFVVLPGDSGVRVARALGTVAFSLAAVPVYLLAREVVSSRWRAVAAALLAVAIPWVMVSTVLFSEALAYPLFCTLLLAMTHALRAPSWRREVVVLGLIGALIVTRTQSVLLLGAWIVLVVALHRSDWRRFPLTSAIVAAGVLVLVGAALTGKLGTMWDKATGPYLGPGAGLHLSIAKTALFEVAMIGLGTGVIPLILAVTWWWPALRGRLGADARLTAAVCLTAAGALWALALMATGLWSGADLAEERYFIYAAPVILVASFAAPRPSTRTLAIGGVVALVVLAFAPITAGLSSERAFLVPVAATLTNLAQRIDGVPELAEVAGTRRLLAIALGAGVLAVTFALLRTRPRLVLVPAIVLQLAFGAYAWSTMHGNVPGVPGVTGPWPDDRLAWIDEAVDGDVSVLVDSTIPSNARSLGTVFWNDDANRTTRFPGVVDNGPPYPVSSLPQGRGEYALGTQDSPFVQLGGKVVARRGTDVLLKPDGSTRWEARGLQPDGAITAPVTYRARGVRATLTLIRDGRTRTDVLPTCRKPEGTIEPRPGLVLTAVKLEPC